MQIATLNYRYQPKEKGSNDSRAKLCHRHTLTTITNPTKKIKPRRSLRSNLSGQSNGQLPPINQGLQRRSSIRIQGSSLSSSKLGDISACSYNHRSRSHSRQSNISDHIDGRNGSITPNGMIRSTSRLVRLRFGYPVKLRTPEFYASTRSEAELHLREDSFINDSIRAAHQYHQTPVIPRYEALDDPHLRRFFQSPIVLDVVRKTLNIDSNNSYKQDDRSSKMSMNKRRSKSNDLYENHRDDYRRIVTKGSSGYAKLNGYDCLPVHAPARRLSSNEPRTYSFLRQNTFDSRLNHTTTTDKNRTSIQTSMTSIQMHDTKPQEKHEKKRSQEKSKTIRSSSPAVGDLAQRSFEIRTTNIETSLNAENNNNNSSKEKIHSALTSSVSQD